MKRPALLAALLCARSLAAAASPAADSRVFGFGELLYMRPAGGMPAYAQVDPDRANIGFDGPLRRLSPGYEPGFRFGLGYALAGGDAQLRMTYSQLDTRAKDSVTEPPGGRLFRHCPTQVGDSSRRTQPAPRTRSATASWTLR